MPKLLRWTAEFVAACPVLVMIAVIWPVIGLTAMLLALPFILR